MMKRLVKCSEIHRQMQEDSSPSDGDNKARKSSPVRSPDQSENPQFNTTSTFTSAYSAIFQPNSPLPTSVSFTPSDCSYDEENNNAVATENRLQQARYVLEYQELYDQYTLCVAHLQETTKEVELLRQENANLRFANKELLKRLNLLSQATIQNSLLPSGYPPLSLVNDFHCLSIGGSVNDSQVKEEISDISPTSVIGSNQFETSNVERVTLPKSISVRSSGYLKMNQGGGNNGGPSRNANRQRVTSEALGARVSIALSPVELKLNLLKTRSIILHESLSRHGSSSRAMICMHGFHDYLNIAGAVRNSCLII